MTNVQEQRDNVIGGNYQDGVPLPIADPPLSNNQTVRPNGDMSILSTQDFLNHSIYNVILPITEIPAIFETKFNSNEEDNVPQGTVNLTLSRYPTTVPLTMPNIATFIGYVITGYDIDAKYMHGVMRCCDNYLSGLMEILPSGRFSPLITRRDGMNRRYSQLCKIVYFTISSTALKPLPSNAHINVEIQSLIQDIFVAKSTSMYVKVKQYEYNNEKYDINRQLFATWATSTPWHALFYNKQSPLTVEQYQKIFMCLFAIMCGKRIRYNTTSPDVLQTDSILPNSDLNHALDPEGTTSYVYNISTAIPNTFIAFMRLLQHAQTNDLPWDELLQDPIEEGNGEDDEQDGDQSKEEILPEGEDEELGF